MQSAHVERHGAVSPMLFSRDESVAFASGRVRAGRLWPIIAAVLCLGGMTVAARANQFVELDYNLSLNNRSRDTVFIELFDDRPLTRDNFMQYVNSGLFDGTFMHRLARNFVLQGGGFYPYFLDEPPPVNISLDPTKQVDLDGNPNTNNPTVVNEFNKTPFRSNLRGTIAMAKVPPPTGGPDSATNQWFVNLQNNAGTAPDGLDFQNGGFTVFAEVRGDGMTLFDAFNSLDIANLNPDFNDNGQRDSGYPFTTVPFIGNSLVELERARRIDYYGGTGSSTTLDVPSGGYTIATRDAFFDAGTTFTGTGSLTIGAGRTLGVREGVALDRHVNNLGTLEPGLRNGQITAPSYQQGAGGTLAIDIRGTTVDTHYDRLIVTGAAQLAGKLRVDLLNLYVPQPGQTFTVLTAGSISGQFSTFELPNLQRFIWTVNRTATAVTLSVLAGDYNDNGTIDAGDYVAWRNTLGTTHATAYAGADGNGDKTVNLADYNVWKSNYGLKDATLGGGGGGGGLAAAVPEPMGGLLAVLAGALLAIGRARRPRSR